MPAVLHSSYLRVSPSHRMRSYIEQMNEKGAERASEGDMDAHGGPAEERDVLESGPRVRLRQSRLLPVPLFRQRRDDRRVRVRYMSPVVPLGIGAAGPPRQLRFAGKNEARRLPLS